MKRIMTWMLALALLLSAVGACAEGAAEGAAEGDALTFDTLAGLEWSFCSGAGGWSTDMRFTADGAFSGEYHDSEMGETGDDYPNGTIYISDFTGQMSILDQVDENSWRLRVDRLSTERAPGEASIDDGVRYVSAEPFGISEGDEMVLYRPGTPTDQLTEDMRVWAHLIGDDAPKALENWFLCSEKNDSGFVGYALDDGVPGLANPWVDMTEDELRQASGLALNLPEGAQDAVWRWNEGAQMAEVQFTLDGDEYCARVKPEALEAGQVDNISGMYFQWDHEEPVEISGCPGTLSLAQTGSADWVELCLWYDVVPGLMYSLSVYTSDPDGLDVTAVAQAVYAPAQGNA